MSALEVELALARGAFRLDARLEVAPGAVTALYGPSGAGKTSLLRAIAGLDDDARGRVSFGGDTWQDERAFVPPHRRPIGYVFQEPSLFPHLDVRGNLAFAWRRVARARRRVALEDAVRWLGLEPLLARRTTELSGGERQRVALARALLRSPALLLLDEPLSAVDEGKKRELLPWLAGAVEELGVPTLWVSHSARELARVCDRIVWLEVGRVRASGGFAEVTTELAFARARGDEADALIEGVVAEHDEAYELSAVESAWGRLWIRRLPLAPGTRTRVLVLARDVSLGLVPEKGSSILNELPATILAAEADGPGQMLVRLANERGGILLARITRRSYDALALAPGRPVQARVKSVSLFD